MGSQTTYMKGRKDGGKEGRERQGREGEREKKKTSKQAEEYVLVVLILKRI